MMSAHLSSYFALGAAAYNLYYLKQHIIKKAIWLTKSKNPRVIKFVIKMLFDICDNTALLMILHRLLGT